MNELKLYHRIGNFSIQIQLLIIKMLKKIYPNLWPLTDRNIDYLVDVYNLMKDCNCFHCRYITFPYTLLFVYKDYPNFTFIRYHIFYLHRVKNISYSQGLIPVLPTELKDHIYRFHVNHKVLQKQFLHNELFLFFMINSPFIMCILREEFPDHFKCLSLDNLDFLAMFYQCVT